MIPETHEIQWSRLQDLVFSRWDQETMYREFVPAPSEEAIERAHHDWPAWLFNNEVDRSC